MENRRTFIKKTALSTAGVSVGLASVSAKSYGRILGANDRVNMAVIGLRGRGKDLMRTFSGMYDKGILVKTVCDVDSQYHDVSVQLVAENQKGSKRYSLAIIQFSEKQYDARSLQIGTVCKK